MIEMTYYIGDFDFDPLYLEHHGILGMKWGVRRYQNKDGTLTAAGKERYGIKNDNFNGRRAFDYAQDHLRKNKDRTLYIKPFSTLYGNREEQAKMIEAGRLANEQEAAGMSETEVLDNFAKSRIGDYADVKISDVVKLSDNKKYLANEKLSYLVQDDLDQLKRAASIDTSDLSEAQKVNFNKLVTIPTWDLNSMISKQSGDFTDGTAVSLRFKQFMQDYNDAYYASENSDEMYNFRKTQRELNDAKRALVKSYTSKYVDEAGHVTDSDGWRKAFDNAYKSSEMKKIERKIDANRAELAKIDEKYKYPPIEKLCEIVLKDLGFTPTKAAISYIYPIVAPDM